MIDLSDEKKRRIAFHEAGHAWMLEREGLVVRSVSINPPVSIQGDNRGETVPEKTMEEGRKEISDKFVRAALAGSAAEHYLLGSWDKDGLLASAYDTGRARSYLAMTGNDWKPEAMTHYVQALSISVMEEISQPKAWHAITSLAYELLESGTLTGEKVARILADR